jgi:hypothetical protein
MLISIKSTANIMLLDIIYRINKYGFITNELINQKCYYSNSFTFLILKPLKNCYFSL